MAKAGRRFPLLIYRAMMNRWWPVTLTLGLALLLLAWPVYGNPLTRGEPWRWMGLVGMAGFAFVFTLILLVMRGFAYVQAFPTYIKLVTPFARINISYKRLRKTTSAEVGAVFPPNSVRGWKREVIGPLASKTALILELTGWPADPKMLRIALSSFFFKDKTPHFVILVEDWMRLSMEIDSMRTSGGIGSPKDQQRPRDRSILSRLPRRDA
ncbi:MAG: hypothetical protein AB1750_18630 [Chloroflexota bacterium]